MKQFQVVTDPDTITREFVEVLQKIPVSLITKLLYKENYEYVTDEEKQKVARAFTPAE